MSSLTLRRGRPHEALPLVSRPSLPEMQVYRVVADLMKRSPLQPGAPPARRMAIKKSRKGLQQRVERDWTGAWAKVEREGVCRVCGREEPLDPAHTIAREYDDTTWRIRRDGSRAELLVVDPASIIPLCRRHHSEYDEHKRDILHLLTLPEQLDAVKRAGGLELARKRLCPSLYEKGVVS